jgi:hypothetical protein
MTHACRDIRVGDSYRAVWPVLAVVWAIAVGGGVRVLWSYEMAPGLAAAAPVRWPHHSHVPRPSHPTLVVMMHPRCPCSYATLEELDVLLTRVQNRLSAVVLFVVPPGLPGDPETSDLWRRAARIRNVSVVRDNGGREARRFGVETSGTSLLYAATGELLFSGGITASRGHVGDNAGVETIVRRLLDEPTTTGDTPVFGCPLRNAGGATRAVF